MTIAGKYTIALEEHYYDPELAATFDGPEGRATEIRRRLDDLGELRIREMDESGIDLQVISHGAPSTQRLNAESAVRLARGANDRLHQAVLRHPDRFAGFAALPTPDPTASVVELERTVKEYGFKGAMVHGLTNGVFFDDKRFWPIMAKAAELDVPIYLHPAVPDQRVVEAYYKDYLADYPGILTAAWGFTMETATAGMRMVLSGAFEAYPNLKIILGHLGEGLPFLLWRINMALQRPGNKPVNFQEVFSRNVYITTSGNFSTPALICSMLEMGIDHILYSVDYPFVLNPPGTKWMEDLQVSAEDKEKILSGNAKRLLRI
ncbi:MAG: amidohydrolase [Dehalococcoidia bacterium]|nr:amidohydrolase [Dehalococcoidia bacterium]